jgi:prevent-host-death family protein
MKKMEASSFKRNCLAVMDEVQARHETVVITKHGRAVAMLVPANTEGDEIYNFLAGKGSIVGDDVSPAISAKGGANSSDHRRRARDGLAGV